MRQLLSLRYYYAQQSANGAAFECGILNTGLNHLIARYDSYDNEISVFVNGVMVMKRTALHPVVGTNFLWTSTPNYTNFGTYHFGRMFNYALSEAECLSLWNNGNPLGYMLPESTKGAGTNKCVAEYIPCGLLPDKWRDTSGNGLDLTAVGTPQLTYERAQSPNEIVVDTGVFYTDIAAGVASKAITIPPGYYIERIIVRNFNIGGLTKINAVNGYSDLRYIANGILNMVGGRDIAVSGDVYTTASSAIVGSPQIYCSQKTTPIIITATGNTTNGGMRVKLICKYIGV